MMILHHAYRYHVCPVRLMIPSVVGEFLILEVHMSLYFTNRQDHTFHTKYNLLSFNNGQLCISKWKFPIRIFYFDFFDMSVVHFRKFR